MVLGQRSVVTTTPMHHLTGVLPPPVLRRRRKRATPCGIATQAAQTAACRKLPGSCCKLPESPACVTKGTWPVAMRDLMCSIHWMSCGAYRFKIVALTGRTTLCHPCQITASPGRGCTRTPSGRVAPLFAASWQRMRWAMDMEGAQRRVRAFRRTGRGRYKLQGGRAPKSSVLFGSSKKPVRLGLELCI